MELRDILKNAKKFKVSSPLVDSITNTVTMNDVAQTILSYGGKPMMIDDLYEIEEGVIISNCLHINIGTLGCEKADSILKGAKKAKENNIPIVLDPVGCHVTKVRRDLVKELLDIGVTLIKGNLTEVKNLLGLKSEFIGIDSMDDSGYTEELRKDLRAYSKEKKTIIVITGKEDYITDGFREIRINNGVSKLSLITGTGCMLGGMLSVECGKDLGENLIFGCTKALLTMGISGEFGEERSKDFGLMKFKYETLDKLSILTDEEIIKRGKVKYEEF